jgi:hypothetical protein
MHGVSTNAQEARGWARGPEPCAGPVVYVAMGKRWPVPQPTAARFRGVTAGSLGLAALFGLGGVTWAALPLRARTPSPGVAPPAAVSSYQVPPSSPVPPPFTITPPPHQVPPADANSNGNYSLSREVIRRVIWVHVNQIKFCYQQALSKQPMLAGRLTAVFQIDPQGRVQSLALRDSEIPPLLLPGPGSSPPMVAKALPLSQAPQLLSCIGEAMRFWEFPPTPYYSGTTEISYPFVLKPRIPDPPPGIQVSDDELAALGVLRDPEPPSVDILF